MKREELIAEARRLKKKADEIEFFISGLSGERQQVAVSKLSSKVSDLRSLQKSYEELANPLPPAEGAEEYLRKHPFLLGETEDGEDYLSTEDIELIKQLAPMLEEFATLHAQRLAEKMVEEKLIEFGNMIRDEPNGDIPALAEYFMRTINLKSREK